MKRVKVGQLLDQALLLLKTNNNNSGQFNRVLCAAVLIGYLISWSSVAYDALVSKPGTVLPPRFHIWTVFSAPLVENHLLVVLFNVLFILTLGKVVSPLWGDVGSIIYFAVVNLSTITVCSFIYLILYILRGDLHYLYYVRLHGLTSYIVALSVAVKQAMPEQVVVRMPNDKKIRNRNIPLILVLLSVILWLTRIMPSEFMLMAFSGWITGFSYLRYFQKHSGGVVGPGGQSGGDRGDLSDAFSFATYVSMVRCAQVRRHFSLKLLISFFPKVLQPAVQVLSTACFDLLVKAKICRKPIRRYVMGVPLDGVVTGSDAHNFTLPLSASRGGGGLSISVNSAGGGPLLSSPTYDEERRRNIAVKALSERLPPAAAATLVPSPGANVYMPAAYTPVISPVPPSMPSAAFAVPPQAPYSAPYAVGAMPAYYNPSILTQQARFSSSTAGGSAQQPASSDLQAAMSKFLSPVATTTPSEQQRRGSLPPSSQPATSSSLSAAIPAKLNVSSVSLNTSSPQMRRAATDTRYDAEAAKESSTAASSMTASSSASSFVS